MMKLQIENIVQEAGKILADRFRQGDSVSEKERFHLVTNADREVEQLLVNHLRSLFPGDGILGEESGEIPGDSGARWLVDPLDGTTDFVMGKPYFAVSLAREERGQIVGGYVYNPISDEFYLSTQEAGTSYLNGKRISVSQTYDLREALVVFGFSARMERIRRYYEEWQWVFEGCRKGVGWTTPALTLCNVARGRIDAFIDFGASPVGHAAAAFILRNAGGVVRSYDLKEYNHGLEGVIGCTPGLLAEMEKKRTR
jgi:myo-inositol-1(or 4)-monophosphatase